MTPKEKYEIEASNLNDVKTLEKLLERDDVSSLTKVNIKKDIKTIKDNYILLKIQADKCKYVKGVL